MKTLLFAVLVATAVLSVGAEGGHDHDHDHDHGSGSCSLTAGDAHVLFER
jgi:hypothetical protein